MRILKQGDSVFISDGDALVQPDPEYITGVQVAGVDLVPDEDGKVNVPIVSDSLFGVAKTAPSYGTDQVSSWSGRPEDVGKIRLVVSSQPEISARVGAFHPICSPNLDYAVKVAMCDGVGPSWTDSERAAAQERIGIGGLEAAINAIRGVTV